MGTTVFPRKTQLYSISVTQHNRHLSSSTAAKTSDRCDEYEATV